VLDIPIFKELEGVEVVEGLDGKTYWCECCGGAWAEKSKRRPFFCKKCSWSRATVSFCVVEAKDLKSVDFNGLADPYAKVIVEDEKFQTPTVHTTLHPVWGSEPSCWNQKKLLGLGHGIHVAVFDTDKMSADDFMVRYHMLMIYVAFAHSFLQ